MPVRTRRVLFTVTSLVALLLWYATARPGLAQAVVTLLFVQIVGHLIVTGTSSDRYERD